MTRSRWLATNVLAKVFSFVLAVGMASREIAADEPVAHASQWFKGNLHTHSLWSDGNDFPEMICDWYQRAGYQFLALSDHNILSEGVKWMDVEAAAKRGAMAGWSGIASDSVTIGWRRGKSKGSGKCGSNR